MKKFVVYWTPLNNLHKTLQVVVSAFSENDAILRVSKLTMSKAVKYCREL